MAESQPASTPATEQKTTSVTEHLPADRKEEPTAHLTLPSVPRDGRFDSSGTATDPDLIEQGKKERELALGRKPAPGESAEEVATAGEAVDNREVIVETDKATGEQTAHTVIKTDAKAKADEDAPPADVTGRTTETAQVSGEYVCTEHAANRIPMKKGSPFPPCSVAGGHSAAWQLVAKS